MPREASKATQSYNINSKEPIHNNFFPEKYWFNFQYYPLKVPNDTIIFMTLLQQQLTVHRTSPPPPQHFVIDLWVLRIQVLLGFSKLWTTCICIIRPVTQILHFFWQHLRFWAFLVKMDVFSIFPQNLNIFQKYFVLKLGIFTLVGHFSKVINNFLRFHQISLPRWVNVIKM